MLTHDDDDDDDPSIRPTRLLTNQQPIPKIDIHSRKCTHSQLIYAYIIAYAYIWPIRYIHNIYKFASLMPCATITIHHHPSIYIVYIIIKDPFIYPAQPAPQQHPVSICSYNSISESDSIRHDAIASPRLIRRAPRQNFRNWSPQSHLYLPRIYECALRILFGGDKLRALCVYTWNTIPNRPSDDA